MAARPDGSRGWTLSAGWQVTIPALMLLLAPGVLAFGPVFGGPQGWIAAAGGAVLGLGVAFIAASRRWGWTEVLATTVGAYLLFGGALALPKTTIAGVVPTLDTLQRLVPLTAYAWRDLLTVSLPASLFTGPAVVPYLAALLCAVVGGTVGLRAPRPAWALLPLGLLLAVGILWGTRSAPFALAQGAGFGVVAVSWLAWRARQRATADSSDLLGLEGIRAGARSSWLGAAGIIALATVAAVGLIIVLPPPTQRFVLRDTVQPPLDMHQYASPLTMYRYLERDLHDQTLFTIMGLPKDTRVRLATVDAYDGVVYNIDSASAAYVRVGSDIGQDLDLPGTPSTLSVEVGAYQGIWLPGGGDLRGVTFAGSKFDETLYYNRDSGTALTTAGLGEGDSYSESVVLQKNPATTELAGRNFAKVALPTNTMVPEAISTMSQELVGNASTPVEQVTKLAEGLRAKGFYSDGTDGRSRAGHTAERLTALLTAKQMIGDDEQYAVAMALMARQLGIPARVVMGFYPDANQAAGYSWVVKGSQAHVWVEVAFDGAGWVAFDPTPDRAKTPNTDVPQPKSDPKPQVLPPPEQQSNSNDDNKDIVDDKRTTKTPPQNLWLGIVLTVAGVAGGVAVVASPFVAVVALKRRRRKRRLSDELLSDRAHGGWLEVVDRATDLGRTFDPSATRRETSSAIEAAFPETGSVAVADRIDAGVFAQSEPSSDEVAAMWTEVDAVLGRMALAVPRWRRALGAVSPRSLGLTRRGLTALPAAASLAVSGWFQSLVLRVTHRKKDIDV